MKFLLIVCVSLWLTVSAEKPAPYPPKGWKPQGARLELPPSRAYGTPQDAGNVEFTTSVNEYIPPATQAPRTDDFLSVQGLPPPAPDALSQFQNFQRQSRIVMAPAPAFGGRVPLLLSPAFAPQFAAPSQQLREQQFGRQQSVDPKSQVQQVSAPQQQYGVPNNQYGPPEATTEYPEADEPEQQDEESEEDSDEPAIAVSNASAQTKLLAATQQGQFGQYYVLLPDSSLQKVRFATGQSADDRQANGFSAQLKYSPVEPIKDPVFGYDEQGKLVRLF